LLRKAHEAKLRGDNELVIWGTGTPRREFLYVDDMADACVFLMENDINDGIFNVGTGTDVTIRELAEHVCKAVNFEGHLMFDSSKPDGTMKKLLNVDKMCTLNWSSSIGLDKGIPLAYQWFMQHTSVVRGA
jgi:GDP-L-fucose synthase